MHRTLRILVTALLVAGACGQTPAVGSITQHAGQLEVSIVDFGAIPDDGLDDRVAMQAALDAAAGGIVHVPVGHWSASRAGNGFLCLSIPAGTTLIGDDRAGSVIEQMPSVAGSVRLLQPGHGGSNPPATPDVTIENLTLDGNRSQQTADEHRAAVFASNAPGLHLLHVTAQNFTGDGFYLYNHTDNATVTDVLATGNDRDGIVFGGGTTGGVVSGSTFAGNRVQQFDTEGGAVANLTVSGNVIDGTGSNDYAMTATGGSSTARSSGWLISGNTINGGLELLWIDSTLVTLNHGVNSTTKPSVTLWRTTNDVHFTGNNFLDTQTLTINSAIVYIAGTGTGSATSGFVAKGNVLTATGHPSMFGYRIEGAVSVEIWDDVITGPGLASPGAAGVFLRATNTVADFQLALVMHNTVRNFGALGMTIGGNGAARLDVLEVAYNTFDDSSVVPTMKTALSLDTDRVHAAKDVRVVGNVLSGGCATALAATPVGVWSAWGDRWMQP